jgi:hypothetical protein
MATSSRAAQAATSSADNLDELYQEVWAGYPHESVGGGAIGGSPDNSVGYRPEDYSKASYLGTPKSRTSYILVMNLHEAER